jgi:6-phosphogluconolactonase (cycloisomerase 2 family)
LLAAPAAATPTSDNPIGLVAHPTADFLYVSGDSGALSVFAINSATGALTLASSVNLNNQTAGNSAVLTPTGEFLYQDTVYPSTDSPTTGEIEGFAASSATGALSPAAGSPFSSTAPGTASLLQMAIDPGGRFLYVSYQYFVTNLGMDGGVAAYSIDANSGALTAVPGSPFGVGGVPVGLTIDASGKLLIAATYAALGGPAGNCLAVLSIDPATGALAAVPGSPFGPLQSCGSVIADPADPLVYAGSALTTSNSPATVAVLSIDPTTGALTPAASTGFPDQRLGVAFLGLTH